MKKVLFTTALALISTAAAAEANDPSRIVVFGDSSADLGTLGPDTRPTNQGQMWSERLAGTIGLSSQPARAISTAADGTTNVRRLNGTNYAINGSTALPFDDVFTLKDQVDFFVQDRGRFAADDLVFVWITRNDITTAAAQGVDYNPEAYANAFAREVDRLRALGARYIVSFGAESQLIPRQYALDLGVPPEALDALGAATKASEAALWPKLATRDVFILDMDRLAEDVRTNPGRYGFRATTESYQGRGDAGPRPSQSYPNDGNVFTADGHYTSAMQAVVADFALAQLRGREQFASAFAVLGEDFRLSHAATTARAAEGRRLHDGEPGWRVFGGAGFEAARQDSSGRLDPGFEDDGYAITAGADANLGNDLLLGVQLSAQQRDGTFSRETGGLDRQAGLLSVYMSKGVGAGFSLEGALSAGLVQVESFERRAALGSVAKARATGETDGAFLAARVGGAYAAQLGAWGVEAGGGLSIENTELDAFDENRSVLALSYGDAQHEALRADVHATVRYGEPDARFSPHVSVRYQHDLKDDPLDLEIGPTKATRATYRADRPNASGFGVEVGAAYRITPSTVLTGGLSLDETDEGDETTAVRVALSQKY